MNETLEQIRSWGVANEWVLQVFIVILVALFLSFLQKILLKKLLQRLQKTRNPWDDALVESAQRPVTVLIWVLGITFAADIIHAKTQAPIFQAVDPIRDVAIIATIGWFLIRLVNRVQANIIEGNLREDRHYDHTTVDALSKLVRAAIIITTSLVVLQTLGYSISGVLAFGGIGGIAVGFAAKDLLANFFGGLMIYLDRPFAIGDWIRSPDRDIEGTVKAIGWRLTTIQTFDKRPLYIPNSVFASIVVENPQRMSHRRIYETIGVRYTDIGQMGAITAAVKKMLQEHPEIDDSQTLMVNFNAFNASSCDFFVYTFTHTTVWTRFHEIKQEILLTIADIIADHGAEIAFPTRTLHIPDPVQIGPPPQAESA